jgi:uncharacterized heparinase superfamily protein
MINFFKNKEKSTVSDDKIYSNIAALLIHAAKIDENYEEAEKEIIKKTLIELGAKSSGVDSLISINSNRFFINNYSIRFHLYPGINAVQTMDKNSVIIQLEKNKSLVFTASGENLSLEKSIFLGRNQIINNSCINVSGILKNNESKKIHWNLKKNN